MIAEDRYEYGFTVFTPAFNRVHTLSRVFESLRSQTYRDFEWLVVDDGSSDGTREIVDGWRREACFPIRYLYQPNRGKHTAFNRGVAEARGYLFLTLDSDDRCVPEALERLKYHWDRIPAEEKPKFSAVTVLCVDERGELVGSKFPRDVTDSDSIEIRYRYRVEGEKWGFQRTDVLRAFPFPEPGNERFVPETIVWGAIARHFKTRYVNEALRIYYQHDDQQTLRLGQTSALRHAVGNRMYVLEVLKHRLRWFPYKPVAFFHDAANYSRLAFYCGLGFKGQMGELRGLSAGGWLLWLVCLPVGYAVYMRDLLRARTASEPSH